jgi:hypothetical protein
MYLYEHSIPSLVLDTASTIEIGQFLVRGNGFALLTGEDMERSDLITFCILAIRMWEHEKITKSPSALSEFLNG